MTNRSNNFPENFKNENNPILFDNMVLMNVY